MADKLGAEVGNNQLPVRTPFLRRRSSLTKPQQTLIYPFTTKLLVTTLIIVQLKLCPTAWADIKILRRLSKPIITAYWTVVVGHLSCCLLNQFIQLLRT